MMIYGPIKFEIIAEDILKTKGMPMHIDDLLSEMVKMRIAQKKSNYAKT